MQAPTDNGDHWHNRQTSPGAKSKSDRIRRSSRFRCSFAMVTCSVGEFPSASMSARICEEDVETLRLPRNWHSYVRILSSTMRCRGTRPSPICDVGPVVPSPPQVRVSPIASLPAGRCAFLRARAVPRAHASGCDFRLGRFGNRTVRADLMARWMKRYRSVRMLTVL